MNAYPQTMRIAGNLKRVLALVIALCFFLPLAQCTHMPQKVPAPSETPPASASSEVVNPPLVPAQVAYNTWELEDCALPVAFVWPCVFVLLRRRPEPRWLAPLLDAGEMAAALVAGWYLGEIILVLGSVRYGGLIVMAALTVHFLASAFALWGHASQRERLRRAA